MFENENYEELSVAADNLRMLHEDVCYTIHALYDNGDRYLPYEPTYFLYNYFCFNTIFNIDWEKSSEEGYIINHRKGSEVDHIKSVIEFCFSDTEFAEKYIPTYRRIITLKYDTERVLNAIKDIIPDKVRIDNAKIGTFKASCQSLFSGVNVDAYCIKSAFSFIYDVRCNIVHGTKSMQHMTEPGQRERITIYSLFIIGLLHMLFMKLQCARESKTYSEVMSDSFLQRIVKNTEMIKY